MPVLFYLPPMLLLGPAIAALLVYAVLRWVIWPPGAGTSPQSVSEHGLWVGVIGWLASSLQGAMTLGIIPANPSAAVPVVSAEAIVPALAWPVLGCLSVHALGQVSYPGPRRMRRKAVLSVRRIKDFLPRRLALTTAAIFVSAATAIARAATLPGFAAVAPTTVSDGRDSYYNSRRRRPHPRTGSGRLARRRPAGAGRRDVAGSVADRPPPPAGVPRRGGQRCTADHRDEPAAAHGVHSGCRAGSHRGELRVPSRSRPSRRPTSWTNFAGLAATVVLLVMWWWRPPRLAAAGLGVRNRPESGVATGRQHPAARLVSSLGALLGLAAAVPLVAGALPLPVPHGRRQLRSCGPRGADGRFRTAGHRRRRVPVAAQLRKSRSAARLAPAAGQPRPADHCCPGAARLPCRPRRHGRGAGPPRRRTGLGSGRAAHGRGLRCLPAGVPHGQVPPGCPRCPARPGRRPARHHPPPGRADPGGHPHRPGRSSCC